MKAKYNIDHVLLIHEDELILRLPKIDNQLIDLTYLSQYLNNLDYRLKQIEIDLDSDLKNDKEYDN